MEVHQKVSEKELSLIMEYIHNYARTHFIKNSYKKQRPVPPNGGGGQENLSVRGQKEG